MTLYKGHWVLLRLIGYTFRYKISPHFKHLGESHFSFPLWPSRKKNHLSGRDDMWCVYPTLYIIVICMIVYESDAFHVTHVSKNFCGCQSTCQVVASSLSRGVRYLTYYPCYFGLCTLHPIRALNSRKHCCHWGNTGQEISPLAVYLTTAFGEQMWDTHGFKASFSMLTWSESV